MEKERQLSLAAQLTGRDSSPSSSPRFIKIRLVTRDKIVMILRKHRTRDQEEEKEGLLLPEQSSEPPKISTLQMSRK